MLVADDVTIVGHLRRTSKRPRITDGEGMQPTIPVKQLCKLFFQRSGVCIEAQDRAALVWRQFELDLQEHDVQHADVIEFAELFESFVERNFCRADGHLHCRVCGVAYRLQQALWCWTMTDTSVTAKHRSLM